MTKDNYTLENGDVYEHTFELPDDITVEEFQKILDKAKESLKNTLDIKEIMKTKTIPFDLETAKKI